MGSDKQEEERQNEMQGEYRDKIVYWLFKDRIPVTKLLIVVNAATFFAVTLFKLGTVLLYTMYATTTVWQMPWTLFTYPLIGSGGVIGVLFSCYWLWVAGGTLERSWGSSKFAGFFFVMSAISALGVLAGGWFVGQETWLLGLMLPLAGLTIAFAMANPNQEILFFFILPLKLKYLALLDVAFVLLGFGQQHIVIGICALLGCAFSYWYVRGGHYVGSARRSDDRVIRVRPPKKSILSRLNPFSWFRSRRDRDRLRKLFDDSGMGDNDR